MILSNIKQYLHRNKKVFLLISSFFVISFLMGDVTFAADGESDMAKNAVEFFNGLLKGVSVLLGLMTYLSTMFLSPEWINGSLFGMNTKFKEVWIMVSNMVYFVFAFILIWIAFMNIIGKNADQYQLKQALPKFIVGVIIVPFSWFFVQLVLSVSAILTVSALTLPADSFPDYDNMLQTVEVPNVCTIDITSISAGKDSKTGGDFVKCGEGSVKLSDLMTGGGSATTSIYGVMSMYTYGIIGFDNIDNITLEDKGSLTKIGDVIVKIVFDFLFVLVYSILIIALGMVLMIRGIYIWIYTMLSPIFGLMYFFDKKDGGDGFFAKFNVKEFISLAMVPVYTMLALSFGLLFMFVVGSGLSGGSSSLGSQIVKVESAKDEGSITIGEGPSSVKLIIKGAVSSKSKDASNLMHSIGGGALGVIGALILKLFGIVVLWGTVMAAMRSSDITKAIVEPLHSFGTKVGGIMTSAPGNMPIFGGQSMSSMSTAAGTVSSSITTAQNQRGTKLGQKFSGGTQVTKDYQDTKALTGNSIDSHLSNVKSTIAKHSFDDLVDNSAGIDALTTHLSRLANSNGFKNKETALKLIKDIRDKGVGNANLVSDNLAKLDADAVSSNMSILGGSKNVVKAEVKDNFGKNADTTKVKANVEIKVTEAETGNAIKIDVGGSSYAIDRDSDNKTTNDVDRKQLIKQIVSALNKGISIDEINDKILDNFSDSTDVIKNNGLYYNKDTKKYRSTEADGFEKVESIQTENK